MMACIGCQWKFQSPEDTEKTGDIVVERFDRMEYLYLTSGDFAALQQMETLYPTETGTLIEDVLKLGRVDDPDINTRFLIFFQDSTLQALMQGVNEQYADIDDLNKDLTKSFTRLTKNIPGLEIPRIYTQIGSLDQSVIVGDSMVGISLDKYLGANYPIYQKYGDPDTLVRDVTGNSIEEVEKQVRALQENCIGASRAGANGARAKLEYALSCVRGGTTVIIGHARHHLSDLAEGRVPCTRIGVGL